MYRPEPEQPEQDTLFGTAAFFVALPLLNELTANAIIPQFGYNLSTGAGVLQWLWEVPSALLGAMVFMIYCWTLRKPHSPLKLRATLMWVLLAALTSTVMLNLYLRDSYCPIGQCNGFGH